MPIQIYVYLIVRQLLVRYWWDINMIYLKQNKWLTNCDIWPVKSALVAVHKIQNLAHMTGRSFTVNDGTSVSRVTTDNFMKFWLPCILVIWYLAELGIKIIHHITHEMILKEPDIPTDFSDPNSLD